MQYLATLVLLAMAASQAHGQAATIEYDIINCTAYNLPVGIHHAYHQDCRRYYNCDNNGGGKTTNCGTGTLYNRDNFLCDTAARCESWDQQACFQGFGNRVETASRRFPALCCREYFEYSCADGGRWEWKECTSGQFNPSSQQCDNNFQGDCSDCGSEGTPEERCAATRIAYRSECTFSPTAPGMENFIQRCAQGTVMSQSECQCVASNDNESCKPTIQQCLENDKAELQIGSGRVSFVWPFPEPTPKWVDRSDAGGATFNQGRIDFSNSNQYVKIPFFDNNNFGPESIFRVSFSASQNTGTILSTGSSTQCDQGPRVSLEMNGNQLSFRISTYNNNANQAQVAQVTANVPSTSGTIQVLAIVQQTENGYTLRGKYRVNNGPSSNMGGNNVIVGASYGEAVRLGCPLRLGGFTGSLTEFTFWRCGGPEILFNAF